MRRRFNVTGSCNPDLHYMVDVSAKLAHVREMVEYGEYFIINRPRQYGKTTMMFQLLQHLGEEYVVLSMSFEGTGDTMFADWDGFSRGFVRELKKTITIDAPEELPTLEHVEQAADDLSGLISDFVTACGKPVVLLIDEVDKSSNSQIFLSFLGLLRDKYLRSRQGRGVPTFQSVVLAGVHDIKSLKLEVRVGNETKLNSPWNIAADFTVDMSFNPAEIATLLADFASENAVQMDMPAIADRIHYFSNGHPFLVSKLCKILDEEAGAQNPDFDAAHWTVADIDWAFRWLTRESYTTTNFDDLVKNLENQPDLYQLVHKVLFEGESQSVSFSIKNPMVAMGATYGILAERHGRAVIHNRIYEQILADYMRSKLETSLILKFDHYLPYVVDGRLDMMAVLQRFQGFMQEQRSTHDDDFLEREGRLIFTAFLKPIINGRGFMWKEPVVGDERRMDLVITMGSQKEVLELKLWRGEAYHRAGLQQLSDYLDFQGLTCGFLLIFDFRKSKESKHETIAFADKTIEAVWV